jgi:hypothetical protein
MAAALAQHMVTSRGRNWNIKEFKDALDEARYWAAYACTTFGGAAECPNPEVLGKFRKRNPGGRSVETIDPGDRVLALLQKAFSG